jgi:hypothetical protein
MAQNIAALAGFSGNWSFGLGMTNLRGAQGWDRLQGGGMMRQAPAYNDDDYVQVATATLLEMELSPQVVVDRLAGRLLRALGSTQLREVRAMLSPPETPPG